MTSIDPQKAITQFSQKSSSRFHAWADEPLAQVVKNSAPD